MSQKKADQMHEVLDTTKTHYEQLEKKYDQANQLLRNYQEREKELLSREENHVEQLRDKDAHYAVLVTQLKERIDELESKLEEMDQRRQSITAHELNELRDKLRVSYLLLIGLPALTLLSSVVIYYRNVSPLLIYFVLQMIFF
uniref:HOOK domain-containing protein n=1 Tax=Heterorhabditis bacteriophora TaxID=37862 RepID=A0A1I7WB43_HETBA